MSLRATNSRAASPREARSRLRPILPKPLIPIFVVMGMSFRQAGAPGAQDERAAGPEGPPPPRHSPGRGLPLLRSSPRGVKNGRPGGGHAADRHRLLVLDPT